MHGDCLPNVKLRPGRIVQSRCAFGSGACVQVIALCGNKSIDVSRRAATVNSKLAKQRIINQSLLHHNTLSNYGLESYDLITRL